MRERDIATARQADRALRATRVRAQRSGGRLGGVAPRAPAPRIMRSPGSTVGLRSSGSSPARPSRR
jgi:hypothetical protein